MAKMSDTCPECGSKLEGCFTYNYRDKILTSRFCPLCNDWVPKPMGDWGGDDRFYQEYVGRRGGGKKGTVKHQSGDRFKGWDEKKLGKRKIT